MWAAVTILPPTLVGVKTQRCALDWSPEGHSRETQTIWCSGLIIPLTLRPRIRARFRGQAGYDVVIGVSNADLKLFLGMTANVKLPMAKSLEVSTVAYNPLAGGLLTGKHKGEAPLAGTRFDLIEAYRSRYWHKINLCAVPMGRSVRFFSLLKKWASTGSTLEIIRRGNMDRALEVSATTGATGTGAIRCPR